MQLTAQPSLSTPRFSTENLRAHFGGTQDFEWRGEWPLADDQARAAVLIPLVTREGGITVLLTRRADHLYHHPGQISFPGGRVEARDASSVNTALRETQEEIGLAPESVELLGELPAYATSTGFHVSPVVGFVRPPFELKVDAFEVAEVFEVPLSFVANMANYQRHRVERMGSMRHFLAVPYAGRFIWGATAGMLAMLAAFLEIK
ncbi:MAG TPA: CoA pyrophosphatase [Rhodocyclaceae bacterium]|nr:CoA pyrophosphatase [Rhodocyclaceae bacterium]